MIKNKEFYKLLKNKEFNIPSFIYSFKKDKITHVNLSLALLYGFSDIESFMEWTHDKLYNVTNAKGMNKIKKMYEESVPTYNFNLSFFNNLNTRIHALCIANQFDDNVIIFMYDMTDMIKTQNQIEANYLNSSLNKNAIIRALIYGYENVIKIDLEKFSPTIIEQDGEEVKEKEIQASWDDYTNFILSLINDEDNKRLKPLFSKENIIDLGKSKDGVIVEKFSSNFSISNATKKKNFVQYEIVFEAIKLNELQYVFILVKPIDEKNLIFKDMNLISLVSSDYLSIFSIDDNAKINIIRANKKFEDFFKTYWTNNTFSEAIRLYANRFVDNSDKETFLEDSNLLYIREKLENEKSFVIPFKRVFNNTKEDVEFLFFNTFKDGKKQLTLAIKGQEKKDKAYMIDAMTDLYTYSGFIDSVESTLKNEYKGYVIYFKLKNFDKYNKFFSTRAGDKLLLKLGNIIHRLENDYKIVGGHLAKEEFLVYINIKEDKLDQFVMYLLERIQVTSQYFDFDISCGVTNVKDEIFDISLMVEDAMFASKNTKELVNQNYFCFNPQMKKEIEFEKSEMDFIIKSIKENKIYSYFRPIYKNNNVIGYDYNIRTLDLFRNHNRSLYPFLEKNGLSFNVNKNCVKEILNISSKKNKLFIIYLTKQFLENKKELFNLVDFINKNSLNEKIIISIGTNNVENTMNDTLINFFRNNNIKIMFDYSNSKIFNIESLIKFKPDFVKLDVKTYKDLGETGIDLLEQIVRILYSKGLNLYLANINSLEFKNLDSINYIYTLRGDKTFDNSEISI